MSSELLPPLRFCKICKRQVRSCPHDKTVCQECGQKLKKRIHFTNQYGHWSYAFSDKGRLIQGKKIEVSK